MNYLLTNDARITGLNSLTRVTENYLLGSVIRDLEYTPFNHKIPAPLHTVSRSTDSFPSLPQHFFPPEVTRLSQQVAGLLQ